MKNEFLKIGKLKLGIEAIKEKLRKHASMYKTVERKRDRDRQTNGGWIMLISSSVREQHKSNWSAFRCSTRRSLIPATYNPHLSMV